MTMLIDSWTCLCCSAVGCDWEGAKKHAEREAQGQGATLGEPLVEVKTGTRTLVLAKEEP